MKLYPNLTFNGRCEEAFKFYEECLHGRTMFLMKYENTPMDLQTPPDWRKKVSHATFALADWRMSGSDVPPERYQKPQGFALQLDLSDPAEAERIFNALADSGIVQMPLQETFWAFRFGVLVDQFGIPWVINCEKPSLQS